MTDLYLFAIVNLAICGAIGFIALCRLNAMEGPVLYRVRSEYAGYIAGAIAAGLQPWWNEWPQWGSLSIAGALLLGLIFSGHAWKHDTTPDVATDHAPLGDTPEA